MAANPSCLRLDWQELRRAFSRARPKTGNRMAARIAMMAMTTKSSISVKPKGSPWRAGRAVRRQTMFRFMEDSSEDSLDCRTIKKHAQFQRCRNVGMALPDAIAAIRVHIARARPAQQPPVSGIGFSPCRGLRSLHALTSQVRRGGFHGWQE